MNKNRQIIEFIENNEEIVHQESGEGSVGSKEFKLLTDIIWGGIWGS